MAIYPKFCLESDFTSPDAAICRNLEDCSDFMKHIGVFFDPIFSWKNVKGGAGSPAVKEPEESNAAKDWKSPSQI